MSKILTLDKLKLVPNMIQLILLMVLITVYAYPSVPKEKISEIDQAKAFMVAGKRKEAIEVLDRIISKPKSQRESAAVLEKRKLFLDQFITNDAFQIFQEAKLMHQTERWSDCIKELDKIAVSDQDNKNVMSLRAKCLKSQKQLSDAEKILKLLVETDPSDEALLLDLVELYLLNNEPELANERLSKNQLSVIKDQERLAILKSKYYVATNRVKEAIDVLRNDQEKNLDHIYINYELGMLYYKKTTSDWMTRKYLSLFVSRTRKISAEELKLRNWETQVKQSQEILDEIEKKLGL